MNAPGPFHLVAVSRNDRRLHHGGIMTTAWRTRWTHAQTRGRQIERQADALRQTLGRLADGQGAVDDVLRMTGAIREQLALAEKLAASLIRGDGP